jgi:elongation factor G
MCISIRILGSFQRNSFRKFHISSRILAETTKNYESDVILKAPISTIRNIGIIAHIDAGKTTTTERLLYYSGLTNRIGNVDEGDTITDYMTQEKDRGITIQSAAVTIPWKNNKINVIDTPGHADFTFEVIRSLRVLDGAVTILDAVAGVEAQTEKVWKQAKDLNIPIVAYVNKMDRDGAGFGRTVKEIVGRLGTRAILINIPYFVKDNTQNDIFTGVIDIINKKLIIWDSSSNDGKDINLIDISNENCGYNNAYNEMLKCREAMIETLGELDESIIDNFLNCEDYTKVPIDLLNKVIREQTIKGMITPILCGSSFKNIGVQPLMDAIVNYLPSPIDIEPVEVIGGLTTNRNSKGKNLKKENNNNNNTFNNSNFIPSIIDSSLGCIINNNKNLTTALAFKVINNPNRGLMVFIRVYSGKLQPNSTIINSRTGEKIKIGKLLIMNGDTPLEVKYLSAGNIGVITGTNEIFTGDTLLGHSINKNLGSISKIETSIKLLPINIPPPVFSVAIEPTTVADKRKLDLNLGILLKEDPSLNLSFDEESGQSILSGMGELHLEITKDRLVNDMKVNADISEVNVTYKETILKEIENIEIFENDNENEGENEKFGISISIYPIECEFNEMIDLLHENKEFNEEEDIHLLDINTAVIFDKNSKPLPILKEFERNIWTCNISYEKIINSMLSGVIGSLQMGGRLAKLPIQNVIIYINKWYIPELKDLNNISELIKITRQAINKGLDCLNEKDFTLLEPIMNVKTFVHESDVGNVSQDLMSVRNAKILSIENENDLNNLENLHWNKKQMESTYVPFDSTMQYVQNNNGVNKMVIISEAPLREMIGYLSKLRSLTKGRGIYDMELKGMERVNRERVRQILDN